MCFFYELQMEFYSKIDGAAFLKLNTFFLAFVSTIVTDVVAEYLWVVFCKTTKRDVHAHVWRQLFSLTKSIDDVP